MLASLHVEARQRAVRRRPARRRRMGASRFLALALLLAVAAAAAIGFGYAGSGGAVPKGVRVDGVDVGGMTAAQALSTLEGRWRAAAATPVVFTAAGRRLALRAAEVGVRPDWRGALG